MTPEATLDSNSNRRGSLVVALGLAASLALAACGSISGSGSPTAAATAAPTEAGRVTPNVAATSTPAVTPPVATTTPAVTPPGSTTTPAVTSPGSTPTRAVSPTVAPTEARRDTPTAAPGAAATPRPSSPTSVSATAVTTPATAAPSPTGGQTGDERLPYLDDRSGPEQLLRSYASALDRKEYVRAYSYWSPAAASSGLPPFPEFERGFDDTASVRLTLGDIGGDAGAGQLYFAVPAQLVARRNDGTTGAFVGCYRLHLARPEVQAAPPFRPLAIEAATVKAVPAGADAAALLAGACADRGRAPTIGATPSDPADIGKARYLDERSTAEQVLRSFYNAVNRREYARAYGYWEPGATGSIPPFDAFARGYDDTASTQLRTGPVASDAGAGNVFYTVPVMLVARTTDGAERTFAGCYTLHLAQPLIQAQPPFRPMGIRSAAIQTATAAEAEARLKTRCTE